MRRLFVFQAIALAVAFSHSHSFANESENSVQINDDSLQNRWKNDVLPLLEKHCFDCHTGDSAEAGVDLTRFESLQNVRDSVSVWEQVRGLVRIGAMPPPDSSSLPTDAERNQVAAWIHDTLHYVDCNEPYAPPPITVRRLNSIEYDHAIRDITGVDLQPSREIGFVTDEVGNGFDNQGEVLTVSPLAIEKFFDAAHYVADKTITLDRESLRKQRKNGTSIDRGTQFNATFDVAAGKYEIGVRMEFGFEQDFSVDAQLLVDGEFVEQIVVPPRRENFKWTREFTEGEHTVSILFMDNEKIGGKGGERRKIRIENVSIEGPEAGQPRYPLQHRSIVIATPGDDLTVGQAGRKIAENLLLRTYRRPPSEEAVAEFVKTIEETVSSGGSFEKGVQQALEIALIAPEFFFRIEQNSGNAVATNNAAPGVEYVESFDLASRLSFFLWSSVPDAELLAKAADNSLQNDDVLIAQVDRMLNDPRADSGLVDQFFGQWLGLRNLSTLQVDHPQYNRRLVRAMIKETTMFCADILRNGRLIDILASEHTYVNPRLAKLYGLQFDGQDTDKLYRGGDDSNRNATYINEDQFIRVQLDDSRKGILTQASILTLTSNPTRTSPVKRGKWVLENIIGDPPPPAPPGVPALEKSAEGKEQLSLREQLEIHRADPNCASCHKVMDPIGLGLENFNVIGQYREKDGKVNIDATGQLADGRQFRGSKELLTCLLEDQDKFARHFTTRLLTFALGRGLVRQDTCTVNSILEQTKDDRYNMRDLVRAIVLSDPFRMRVMSDVATDAP
jgi:hypothetical protein